jgi:4-diphosphocytidyl-2-C-methyl-D-erythritol kinase
MVFSIPAHAKINLGLKVVDKRDDGYHDIATFMQRLSLCDSVTLKPKSGEVVYTGPVLTEYPSQNLCVRAAEAFRSHFGADKSVSIGLSKQIPAGAGLGGGSSDAAAVLIGMARIYGVSLLDESLLKSAAEVSFFLFGNSAAIARGRGEQLEAVNGLSLDKWIVILWPGFGISTVWAYKELDRLLTYDKNDIKLNSHYFYLIRDGLPHAGILNDFEIPAFAAHPELGIARDRLLEAGAVVAGLAGSGSALFGIFDGEAQARMAASPWRPPWLSFVCRPC